MKLSFACSFLWLMELVGRTIKKEFQGFGVFTGTLRSFDPSTGFFEILYEDGDSEELEFYEIASLLEGIAVGPGFASATAVEESTKVGRKPKKRRRLNPGGEIGGVSGNTSESLIESFCFVEGSEERKIKDNVNHGSLSKTLEQGLSMKDVIMEQTVSFNGSLENSSYSSDLFHLNHQYESSNGFESNGHPEENMYNNKAFDLNMNVTGHLDENLMAVCSSDSVSETQKRECGFDLNLGFDNDANNRDGDCGSLMEEDGALKVLESTLGKGFYGDIECKLATASTGDVDEPQKESSSLNGTLKDVIDGIQTEDLVSSRNLKGGVSLGVLDANCGSSSQFSEPRLKEGLLGVRGEGNISCRKRRKVSENSNFATETGLRRSTRRGKVYLSSQNHTVNLIQSNAVEGESPPLVFSAVSKEKPSILGLEESKEVLPKELQLPPSSGHLNFDGIPILDVFSIYSFLRSFSILLFLSPFELEDFVAALRCNTPNSLLDSIHVCILQTLRKHLEFLSKEGSNSASICLRDLNWDLLDLITWPMFMVEYLLIHGSRLKAGMNLSRLNLLNSDYYKFLPSTKIEILQYLCDDLIGGEIIRSELNRRTLAAEQVLDVEICKKRGVPMDVSCLSEEVNAVNDDEEKNDNDWNIDECCLCKMDGSLICCDGCPNAYHSRCVGVVSDLLPEGDWYCPECSIERHKPLMKLRKSVRGAEFLGNDPMGRMYYSSCGYLLVSDSCDSESSFHYYHRNDVHLVIDAINLSGILYGGIVSAIIRHWNTPSTFKEADLEAHKNPELNSMVDEYSVHLGYGTFNSVTENNVTKIENRGEVAEVAVSIPEANADTKSTLRVSPDNPNRNITFQSENLQKISSANDWSPTTTSLDDKKDIKKGYVNYYSFAQTASSVLEELMSKASKRIGENSTKTVEEIIAQQLKAISNRSTKFRWQSIQDQVVKSQRENCGWCLSCRTPMDGRDCLFNIYDSGPVLERLEKEVVGLSISKRSKEGHLIDVISHVLSLEDRLRGLLLGPWLNPQHSKLWRRSLLKASDIASVKRLLLTLESNLDRRALSAEWLKHVDSVTTMGSASHIVTSLPSKHGISRKSSIRPSDFDSQPTSNASATGLGMFWWRGGRVSCRLFNWKVLPRSLSFKAGRQAGCTKVEGILYPDGSEFAKRSKYIAWRAAVETSTSAEKLALQVRELDSNVKWDDVENTHLSSNLNKEARKSTRSFKKVIVRRKRIEGTTAKYLLDFGKRKIIPDVVLKHGSVLEESSSERKKYWLEETHVPLHLIKAFEERRISRKCTKMDSMKPIEPDKKMKKRSREKGFSYLFSKAEMSGSYQCGHCNKDVLIRDALSCQHCEGFFHRRHVRKSAGPVTAECKYTCYKCKDANHLKSSNLKRKKLQPPKSKQPPKGCLPVISEPIHVVLRKSKTQSKKDKNSCRNGLPLQSKNKKGVSVGVPLRRSARIPKYIFRMKGNSIGGDKEAKQMKLEKPKFSKKSKKEKKQNNVTCWKKRRTRVCHSYWINGLLLSRKVNDEKVTLFKKKKLLLSSKWFIIHEQPKCRLCQETGSTETLNYIGCEICKDWYHGDAFGLHAENIGKLIGFKCHVCRDRVPPVCPHVQDTKNDGARFDDGEGLDGANQKCQSDELVQDVQNDECEESIRKEQHQSLLSESRLELNLIKNSQGNDLKSDAMAKSREENLSEENLHVAMTSIYKEQHQSLSSESNLEVKGGELHAILEKKDVKRRNTQENVVNTAVSKEVSVLEEDSHVLDVTPIVGGGGISVSGEML